MKLSWFGRLALALFASLALGLGMSACGGGTIAYMWVTGTQYNEIAGFKVDDYTGNLTQVPGEPFPSQGTAPNMLLVRTGGRYVYVLNQGTLPSSCTSAATCALPWTGSGIAVFSVGGDGSLTYLETYHSQGFEPVWMQFDSTSGYLYVLDKYSPGPVVNGQPTANTDGNGSITAFQIDSTTGRLTLVLNTQSVPAGASAPTYWEVGANPLMMKTLGSCLFTVNSADQSITPFSESGGQLVNTTTGKIATGANTITSINGSGSTVVLTDAGANSVITYTESGTCGLSAAYGGVTSLATGAAAEGTIDPTYSFIDSTGKFLYILNQQNTNTSTTQSYSLITGLQIQNTSLTPLTAAPYQVQASPVCMVEDPTNKYMYISNHDPGSVTGKVFDPNTGALSELTRGSNFTATGLAGCMAISGAVD